MNNTTASVYRQEDSLVAHIVCMVTLVLHVHTETGWGYMK